MPITSTRFRAIALLLAAAVQSAAQQPQPRLTRQQALDSLGAVLGRLDAQQGFHGVVLLSDGGRVERHSAHGLAHRGYQVKNLPDTKFNLASVGKTFTAVAIGQLVSQGKLRWSDTLIRVLPNYPNPDVAKRITIAQLLTHRSGMGLYWDALFNGNWTAVRTTADLTPFFVNDTLLSPPGTKWFYSNSGFAVLAMVVERVSGEDFFTYVKKHILDRAGMTSTGYYELDQDLPNSAVGYYRDEKGVERNNLFTHTVRGGGAGGGWSNAPDLIRFAKALKSGALVDTTLLSTMWSKQSDSEMGANTSWGYGFMRLQAGGRTLIGHTGGFAGIATYFFFDRDRDRTAVLMSNDPGPSTTPVWRAVIAYLAAAD